jgi:hypothetical protein
MDPSFAPESAGEQSELYGHRLLMAITMLASMTDVLGAQAIAEFAIKNGGRRTD